MEQRKLMLHGCPITLAYLIDLITECQVLGIQGNHEWRLISLRDNAELASNDRKDLLLRSFLALEIMATRGLKGEPVLGRDALTALRWSRSARGLTMLLAVIRQEIDELRADITERTLLNVGSAVEGAEDLRYTKKTWRLESLETFEASAVFVRRALKSTDLWEKLGVIGSSLAKVLSRSCGFDARVDVASELLEQTADTSRRAWEPKIQSVR